MPPCRGIAIVALACIGCGEERDTAARGEPWRAEGGGSHFEMATSGAPLLVEGEITAVTPRERGGLELEVSHESGAAVVVARFGQGPSPEALANARLSYARYPNEWLRDDDVTITDAQGVLFALRAASFDYRTVEVGPVVVDTHGPGLGVYEVSCGTQENHTARATLGAQTLELKPSERGTLDDGDSRYDVLNAHNSWMTGTECTDVWARAFRVEALRLP